MSYTIEYGRQFIRSEEGITPCWLCGSNNVTEYHMGRERRERHWSCFCGFVGATEDEILAKVQKFLGGYQEHWKKNGKWVNDEAFLRWAKSGIRKAATIEDILMRNPYCGSVQCSIHVWHGLNHTVEDQVFVKTTAEFDDWIRLWRVRKDRLGRDGAEGYPCVDFGTENLKAPIAAKESDRFCFKKNGRYLAELGDRSSCWSRNAQEAIDFSYDEAVSLLRNPFLAGTQMFKMPKETTVDIPRAIIEIIDKFGDRDYIYKVKPRSIQITQDKENAHQYTSLKAAQTAAERILQKYPQIQNARAITI